MAADKGSGAAGSASAEIGKYLEILARDPNSRVFAPLAEAYRKAGLLDDAIETALEGLSVHPNYLGGRVALGRALFEKKRYAEAADELRKVVRAAADNIVAHKVLGQIALAQGNLPEAEKSFRTVALLDPHDREAKQALADIGSGAPAPVVAPPAPPPPSPPKESAWGELSLETALPLEELASPRTPAEASPPPLVDLAEPDEGPPPPSVAFAAEPAAVEPPALEVFADEAAIDMPEIEEPAAPPAPLAPPAHAVEPPSAPAPEIEIFGREPAGVGMPPPAEESPIETFGREKRGVVPHSARGGEAYAEIELEPSALGSAAPGPAAPEPVAPGPAVSEGETGEDAVFQIFTRDPRGEGGPPREARGERPAFEELELEPTAYLPRQADEGEPAVIELREEIPRIDVQGELELALELERSSAGEPPAAAEPAPAAEEIGWDEESPWEPAPASEQADVEPLLTAEEAATEELVSLEEEIPSVDLAAEIAPEAAQVPEGQPETAPEPQVEPQVELTPEPVPEAPAEPAPPPQPAQPQAGRGVFDTETLASIYINQGFYGRAAAIYERLAAGSPEDAGLRRRLEEVRALERAHAGQAAEGEGAAPAAGAGRPDRAETIRRLEALMEAFRRGRPR